jgi:hypothetical protein
MTLWVNSDRFAMVAPCPLLPPKATIAAPHSMTLRTQEQAASCIGPLSYKLCGMKRDQRQFRQLWPMGSQFLRPVGLVFVTSVSSATAQDIRGVEVCTAEKQMERRTGCLQANVEFLQQALIKLARETQEKNAATDRDLTAARAEISALKSTVEKLNNELAQMKGKADPSGKK